MNFEGWNVLMTPVILRTKFHEIRYQNKSTLFLSCPFNVTDYQQKLIGLFFSVELSKETLLNKAFYRKRYASFLQLTFYSGSFSLTLYCQTRCSRWTYSLEVSNVIRVCFVFAFTTLREWIKNLAPLFHPLCDSAVQQQLKSFLYVFKTTQPISNRTL